MKAENTYIGLIRGINVSGQKPIKMNALQELLVKVGLTSVKTYIQSGNFVFKSSDTSAHLESSIREAIKNHFGFEVHVMVFNLRTFKSILDKNPYASDQLKNTDYMHITLLSDLPVTEKYNPIINKKMQVEEAFSVDGRCLYLYCPNGYGKTKLSNNFFEQLFKTNATTRNWKTAQQLLKMAQDLE